MQEWNSTCGKTTCATWPVGEPAGLADMLNALDPAHPVHVPCIVVLPLTGPVGLVPPL
jgi:hypothetical protein